MINFGCLARRADAGGVGRPVRHVRRAEGVELLAQHGNDLFAEQIQLLQHGLQRQAGVVGQEQLPLVVAEVLAEGQGALDHLLRAAHGQRGLPGELLQRRAVSVDRGVVEVGPEDPHGFLAVLVHEHLSAQTDDRLVGGAVTVVLEAGPVEPDQPLEVVGRPEDVVGEESVAVVRGLLGDLRAADRAVPDERRDAVQGPRRGGEGLQRRTELAFPVHHVLSPQPVQQVVVLDGQGQAVADVLAEPGIDRAGVAAAHHQVDPPVGEVLQHRVVLGDLDRVVGGDQGRRGGQDDLAGLRGDVAQQRGRRRRHERGIVVLAGGEDVQADLLGLERDGHHGLDPLGLAGRAAGGGIGGHITDGEDSELHALAPRLR